MSTVPTSVVPGKTIIHNYPLLVGGCFSLAFAVFQISAIWWSAKVLRYFGGPAEMSAEKPLLYALLCVFFGIGAVVFGVYALSGAGWIRRLPLLQGVLIAVAIIYLLRGALAIPQAVVVARHPEFFRYLLFSLISLVVGVVHGFGAMKLYRFGRPVAQAQN
jgi:hypothetical protein